MLVSVLTTQTAIIGTTPRRKTITMQNTGANPIYVKKGVNATVTTSNYDFILYPVSGGDKPFIYQFDTISGFVGIATGGNSTLAVMETVYL